MSSSHHCRRFIPPPLNRREMLARCASGFGGVALLGLLGDKSYGQETPQATNALGPQQPHFGAKAKNIIFLYMDGGPSQVDTFDYKPDLERFHGQNPNDLFTVEPTQFNNVGKVMKSPWSFRQYGESGAWVSELFPHVAEHVDDLAIVKSMVAKFPEHTNANYLLHTGHGIQGRPSMGAWIGYGLGSENENLPGFIVLNGGLIPPGGLDCFGSGFLPAAFQGSVFKPSGLPVANIQRREARAELQQSKLDLMRQLDASVVERLGEVDALESAIANYELAARMQTAVPTLMDVSGETAETQRMYGLEEEFANTRTFGMQCLLARRMVEQGVRFIELTCPGGNGDRWDQHGNLVDGHTKNARSVDQPIAALITDLKQRGLLEETLLVWGGEFGRTPFAQGSNGRDHNPTAFTMWLCGGGIKGGVQYGTTDEFGYKVVENKFEIHDLHANMLHLLGIDHERLTFRHSGRDIRLTDVYGEIVPEILA